MPTSLESGLRWPGLGGVLMGGPRLPAAARREQLLDQALEIVAAEGFRALTVERLARDAGLTRTAIYHQFGGLDGTVSALVKRELRRGQADVMAIVVPPSLVGPGALAYAVSAMLDAAAQAAPRWRVLLDPPNGGPPELYATLEAGRAYVQSALDALLRERVYPISGAPPDPELAVHLLHLQTDELARLYLSNPERYPKERLVSQAVSCVGQWTCVEV